MTEEEKDLSEKKKKTVKYAALILFAVGVTILCVLLFPFLKSLKFEVSEEWLKSAKEWVDSFGALRYAVILVLQLLQVFIAILPGEPIEILAGYMCGTVGGLVVCEIGALLGSFFIYKLVERFGKRASDKVLDSKAYEKLKFLHNTASRDGFVFLLFFLPGTPKDLLTYFAPLLKIGVKKFLLIIAVARIPSIVSSTYVGATLSEGNIAFSVVIFALTAAVGAVGILINDLILGKHRQPENGGKTVEEGKK